MRVTGLSWLGVATDAYPESLRFFTDVLGLEIAAAEDGQALLRVGKSGQFLELFGREGRGKRLTRPPVAAFEVDDVGAATLELVEEGVELVGEIGSWNGFEWQYFKSPDGDLFAIKKTPPHASERADAN